MTQSIVKAVTALALASWLAGCREQLPEPIAFEPNRVYAMRLGQPDAVDLTQALDDIHWVLERTFGNSDDPKLPESWRLDEAISKLIPFAHLQQTCGIPDGSPPKHKGLFRGLCANCHSDTGTGRGQSVLSQNPYPRDFRKGVFKFKMTGRNSKPTRVDISHTIRSGLAGTGMSSFPQLTDAQVEALVSHVIFLSIRGELERELLEEAAFELDLEAGERLIAPEWETDSSKKAQFQAGLDLVNQLARDVVDLWLEAESLNEATRIPEKLSMVAAKPNSLANWKEMALGTRESIERGAKLFASPAAGCVGCHGRSGRGDGRTGDFDDWTKEWTLAIGVDPANYSHIEPFLLIGALPPRSISPRNLRDGVFRSGSDPAKLYLRIKHGIPGTPMPALTLEPDVNQPGVHEPDIWDLVNFVCWLSHDPREPDFERAAP